MEFSLSQILSGTLDIVRSRFGSLLGIWAVYFGISIGAFFVLGFLMVLVGFSGAAAFGPDQLAGFGVGMIVVIFIFYIGYFLITLAQAASLTAAASPLKTMEFGEAMGAGMRSAPSLLGVGIVFIVGYLILAVLFGLVAGVLALLGVAGAILGGVLIIGALIYFVSRLSLIMPVIVIERVRNPFTAIARSWRLGSGNVLTIFLAWLSFIVLVALLLGIAFLPFFGTISSMQAGDINPAAGIGSFMFMFVVFVIVGIGIQLVSAALVAVMHSMLTHEAGENLTDTFA